MLLQLTLRPRLSAASFPFKATVSRKGAKAQRKLNRFLCAFAPLREMFFAYANGRMQEKKAFSPSTCAKVE
jgi:hypothetical protein